MKRIGIVAGGPLEALPNMKSYLDSIDIWIGCDQGAKYLMDLGIPVDVAIGDFDSINDEDKEALKKYATNFMDFPPEKDATDVEMAIEKAIDLRATSLSLFGLTGGRLDHELSAIFLMETLKDYSFPVTMIDRKNKISLYTSGDYVLAKDAAYTYISFLSLTERVRGLSLTNFRYPLEKTDIKRSSSLTLSNELSYREGYFSFDEGILLVIRSRD
ncbi:thiamine diphosphokinase [Pelagirhabdus alkalitolerans]|uniref:Thiamine diphosphokinase n=1 Tax=Pelagirhabdus alkalitolerans TaxID=1612202 RepID=A0A1G6H402_9BACI|nr:thiamine diphosphokinase [Pelagirhabdus alkalitolerans]SDB88146.1 thiamine diphosphokinase [Pelagirhabdus alkalitolerans]